MFFSETREEVLHTNPADLTDTKGLDGGQTGSRYLKAAAKKQTFIYRDIENEKQNQRIRWNFSLTRSHTMGFRFPA